MPPDTRPDALERLVQAYGDAERLLGRAMDPPGSNLGIPSLSACARARTDAYAALMQYVRDRLGDAAPAAPTQNCPVRQR